MKTPPFKPGAHYYAEGINSNTTHSDAGTSFSVFSQHAERMQLCLFRDACETRIELSRQGDYWQTYVAGVEPGTEYGFRAYGPYAGPHRFNSNKLLLDPYARHWRGELQWHDALFDTNTQDSAPFVPKSVVCAPLDPLPPVQRPQGNNTPLHYEAHVKGLTAQHPEVPEPHRGTYTGMASDAMIAHMQRLGVSAIQIMPCQAFVDDQRLERLGLRNYWGYQTLGFFAPMRRYLVDDDISEFRTMVRRLQQAGIQVLLDVVYNHSGEGDASGPCLCFRGLDNASYYRLHEGEYINDTGTGNTLNTHHPAVQRLVLDSMRYWVSVMGVDGFRFDLAACLGRDASGFSAQHSLFNAMLQDPVLSETKLIAEPWDLGPGGYQLGQFPHPFLELNDQFRDTVRRFWRGDAGQCADLASVMMGSSQRFDHRGRTAQSSVNFVCSHDGFTLRDLVSYHSKQNEANGESNRDGHDANYSDDCGAPGDSDIPAVLQARAQRQRQLLATLFLSQGTPMLLAGDEIGHTQQGNNNAYCQDNAISWLHWEQADNDLLDYVQDLSALRQELAPLWQPEFLHAQRLQWRQLDGTPIENAHWPQLQGFQLIIDQTILLVVNAGEAAPAHPGATWSLRWETPGLQVYRDHTLPPAD